MEEIIPPGEHPNDPYVKDFDVVAWQLERIETHLHWIDEHFASFLVKRETDPKTAEWELECLAHSIYRARLISARLTDLILAGYSIDPTKRLPTFTRLLKPHLPENPDPPGP